MQKCVFRSFVLVILAISIFLTHSITAYAVERYPIVSLGTPRFVKLDDNHFDPGYLPAYYTYRLYIPFWLSNSGYSDALFVSGRFQLRYSFDFTFFKTQATSSTSSASVSIIGAGIQGLDSQYYTYGQSGTPVTKWDSYLSSSAGVGSANGVTTTVSADFYASLFDALVALPQPGASWFYAYIDFAITSPAVAYYSWNLGAPNVAVGYMALTASSERKYTDYSPITNTLESISADEMAQRQEIADAQAEQSEKQHEDLKTGFQDDVFDSSVSSAGGSVDSYVKAEEELMNSQNKQINDYADQNFNTGLISNYMTAIASVSTWYTRIWMSFGDLKTVFTVILSLGIAAMIIGLRRFGG